MWMTIMQPNRANYLLRRYTYTWTATDGRVVPTEAGPHIDKHVEYTTPMCMTDTL